MSCGPPAGLGHPSLGGRLFSGQQRGGAQEARELVMADGVRIPLQVGMHGFVEVARGPRAALIGEIAAATRCWGLHAEPPQSSQRCISAGYVEKG